ncbi:hypothetical protein [Bradyrhizobium sp. JYMT SZCCT0428]|uniref:hypothetical protein n=1 Tax=Bradyrhizobium sp. JYMT SZCCT0428 TaxID=2807673 RepID=UPI001BA70B4A|nr:hypothetical protein [Bradyrhizobium sp. JYMT SZCCT0428]MBR1150075.1 hypothetical protein [Bradyrhizobium sp. JYMT SZCCT0428]
MALSDSTLLGLTRTGGGFTLAEFSARGISMQMSEIDEAADIVRDVNYNLINLLDGITAAQKYKFSLSCEDMESPGFAAHGDGRIAFRKGDKATLICLPDLGATAQQTFTVMNLGWTVTRDEWNSITSWSLELEEV